MKDSKLLSVSSSTFSDSTSEPFYLSSKKEWLLAIAAQILATGMDQKLKTKPYSHELPDIFLYDTRLTVHRTFSKASLDTRRPVWAGPSIYCSSRPGYVNFVEGFSKLVKQPQNIQIDFNTSSPRLYSVFHLRKSTRSTLLDYSALKLKTSSYLYCSIPLLVLALRHCAMKIEKVWH